MALYQVAVKQQLLNQEVRNIYYYETSGLLDGSQVQELVDDIRGLYVTHITAASVVDDWRFYGIDFRRVDEPGYLGTSWIPTSGSFVGTNTSDPVPTQVALLVNGYGATQRPNRVRSYLCGWGEGSIGANGQWISSATTSANNFIVAMDTIAVTGDVLTRQAAQWATPDATHVVVWNPIASYAPTGNPATQKRRRIGRGI